MRSPAIKKAALTVSGLPILKKLQWSSRQIVPEQNRILRSILDNCKDTVFGREHGFKSIKTIDDYRKAVPIRDFEGHRPYIDRMLKGERNILFPGKPVFYNTTSGTTDKPKLIPVSSDYYDKAYSNVSKLWFFTCLKDNPTLFNGQNLSAVAPAVEGYVEDGTPYGSISGVVYKNIPAIMRDLYSTPYPVICIKDYQKKYYAMLRFSLATSITYIITVNPSTLLQFHRVLLENAADIIKDIHDGTLRTDVLAEIEPSERPQILRKLKADPQRARWLEELVKTHGQNLRPKHYWPDLVCINTWKQGNCSLILPKLEGYFSEKTVLREFGYQASEARAGLVLGNEWNYSILLANIYHFEFIPEEKIGLSDPPVLSAHELEINKCYYILFSNGSGLYRYNINDIIRVTGFYHQFPLFEFVQKGEGITSLTGEKLSEIHVIRAVDEAANAKGIHVEFYTMLCDSVNYIYKLYVEFDDHVNSSQKQAFLTSVDEHLKYVNPEYSTKRDSNRLKPPVLIELKPKSYEFIKSRILADGKSREGQYKVSCLRKDPYLLQLYDSFKK
ncbi:MAG: GH3 auxin-responsive promoter family protein [Fibrobacter sp.]|nr:GH3 auxin-responsive promoter family protein [Fibrobacter sp.]